MLHALINDDKEVLQFPISDAEIRAMFPNTSFPAGSLDDVDLTHLNIWPVEPDRTADMPTLAAGMKFKLDGAVWNADQTKLLRVYAQVPADVAEGGE